jgi:hypothetical protein
MSSLTFEPLLQRVPMRLRRLPRYPFTDIGRTIPEFASIGLAQSQELHAFSIDKKNVLEIDGKSARFLFQYAAKHVDMFPRNSTAYEQHHAIVSANVSVDSAAHSEFGMANDCVSISAKLLPPPT